jgi:hypothetical protein
VKLRDGPAAVTGNICYFNMGHCENGKAKRSGFNAGSQKTSQVTEYLKLDGKGFCKSVFLQNPFVVLKESLNSEETIARNIG